jgi:hypothetical protein
MRSFGATPFSRNSFNWSVTNCKGFCFEVIVAVSDMIALLEVDSAGGTTILRQVAAVRK